MLKVTEATRNLLGGKGAGLAEMTNLGIPVPPGFTITTEACIDYLKSKTYPEGMWEQTLEALKKLEKLTGKEFGSEKIHFWFLYVPVQGFQCLG